MTNSYVRRMAGIAAVALCVAGPARAQDVEARSRPSVVATPTDSALEARTSAIASTLRCPVCQGESIQDSPSELARQMRAVVRDQLRAGKTPEQVKAYFVYVLPVLLVVGGLALVVFLVRRWTTP